MAILTATALLPNRASAFWPFSNNADAATNTLIPSSSTPTLRAPLNSNPNSSAPIALATSGGSALVSYNGPDGTVADVAGSVQTDRISVYVVRGGDTLSEISDMFGVSINTILWANDLKSSRDVHPGDTLIILPVSGVKWTIKKGDTLKSIAKKYSTNPTEIDQLVADIVQFNDLDPEMPLKINSTIIIPGGELSLPTPAAAKRPAGTVNPYLGGGGPMQLGYYNNPIPGFRVTQGLHGHNGVDFGAPKGTLIRAAADGIVIISRNNGAWNGGYGNYVVITHSNGTQTLYAHMTNSIVSPGQEVLSGQVIGYVGSTGKSRGSHLHFEIRGAANPFLY